MAGNAQQARLNGKLSQGPRTKQGKMKASRNSKKHGLLASHPPLLETEDLATFEGLVQGLVDPYAPSNPVEWHLVNIIAMSIQKQHRIWMFEAAIANKELIKPQKITDKKYPQHQEIKYPEIRDKTEYHPDNRMDESEMINKLILKLEAREDVPTQRSKHFEQDYNIWRRTTLEEIDKLWEWKYNPLTSGLSRN